MDTKPRDSRSGCSLFNEVLGKSVCITLYCKICCQVINYVYLALNVREKTGTIEGKIQDMKEARKLLHKKEFINAMDVPKYFL